MPQKAVVETALIQMSTLSNRRNSQLDRLHRLLCTARRQVDSVEKTVPLPNNPCTVPFFHGRPFMVGTWSMLS